MDDRAPQEETEIQLLLDGSSSKKSALPRVLRGLGAAACIVVMILSWVIMAEELQGVGSHYPKPLFLAYFIHSFYSVLYILWKFWLVFPGKWSCNKVGEGSLTNFRKLTMASVFLALVSIISAVLWYLSLSRTSVAANVAIYQSASAAVFIISVPLLREKVSLLKVVSVALTIAGVSLVSFYGTKKNNVSHASPGNATHSESAETHSTALGYVYVVLSMVFYALFETGFKKFATAPGDPAEVQNSARVLGYTGVVNLFCLWPALFVFHFTGLERFELPSVEIFKLIVLNAFLDVLFNGALFICIALSSPLLATVGSVLVVPSSMLVDWWIHHTLLTWQGFLGTVLIVGGFFSLVFAGWFEVFYWRKFLTPPPPSPSSSLIINTLPGHTINAATETDTKWKLRRRLCYYII